MGIAEHEANCKQIEAAVSKWGNRQPMPFEIVQTIDFVGGHGKVLRIVKWGDGEPKLDIRNWWQDKKGKLKPGKGITLIEGEAADLVRILQGLKQNGGGIA